jgi:hypothetical protein
VMITLWRTNQIAIQHLHDGNKKKGRVLRLHCAQNGWISSVHRRKVDPVDVSQVQLRPAGRALLLSLDGGPNALLAEDVAADSR